MRFKFKRIQPNSLLLLNYIVMILLLGGCGLYKKIKVLTPNDPPVQKTIIEKKSLTIACKPDNIQNYLDKGWTIINKEENKIPCTWKTKKATRRCDIALDKGCKITVPDKYGMEIIYSLEREKELK